MENTTWTKGEFGATLEAEINGHTVELWIDFQDGVKATIVVDRTFTTDSTNDWPTIEAVFPRSYWPAPIYRGKNWDKQPRQAPIALVEAIAQAEADLDD